MENLANYNKSLKKFLNMLHKKIGVLYFASLILLHDSCLTINNLQQKFKNQIEYDKFTRLIGTNFYKSSDVWKCKSSEELKTLDKYKLIDVSILINENRNKDTNEISGFSVTYILMSKANVHEEIKEFYVYDKYREYFFPTLESDKFEYKYRKEDSFYLTFRTERKYYFKGSNDFFDVDIDIANNRFMAGGTEAYLICHIFTTIKFDNNDPNIYQALINSIYGYFTYYDSTKILIGRTTYDYVGQTADNEEVIQSYLWFYGSSARTLYSAFTTLTKNNPIEMKPNDDNNRKIIRLNLFIARTNIILYPIVVDEQIISIHNK